MEIHVIKTDENYKDAMSIIDTLINSPVGSKEAELINVLVNHHDNGFFVLRTIYRNRFY
jgi:hypothetical protein